MPKGELRASGAVRILSTADLGRDQVVTAAPLYSEAETIGAVARADLSRRFLGGPHVTFAVAPCPEASGRLPSIVLSGEDYFAAVATGLIRLYGALPIPDEINQPDGISTATHGGWGAPALGNIDLDRQYIPGSWPSVDPEFSGIYGLEDWRSMVHPRMVSLSESGPKQQFVEWGLDLEGRLRARLAVANRDDTGVAEAAKSLLEALRAGGWDV